MMNQDNHIIPRTSIIMKTKKIKTMIRIKTTIKTMMDSMINRTTTRIMISRIMIRTMTSRTMIKIMITMRSKNIDF